MSIYEYYRQILLINNNLATEIKRYIFSYVIDDFKNKIIDKKIESKIKNYKNKDIKKYKKIKLMPTFHISEMPYNYLLTKENLKNKIEIISKKENLNINFSHYCCNNKGICFVDPDYDLNLFNPLLFTN